MRQAYKHTLTQPLCAKKRSQKITIYMHIIQANYKLHVKYVYVVYNQFLWSADRQLYTHVESYEERKKQRMVLYEVDSWVETSSERRMCAICLYSRQIII